MLTALILFEEYSQVYKTKLLHDKKKKSEAEFFELIIGWTNLRFYETTSF